MTDDGEPGPLEVLTALRTTGTCRSFSDAPVADEDLFRAIDVARFAPQGGNLQPVRWVVVRDRELVGTLGGWYLELFEQFVAECAGGVSRAEDRRFAQDVARAPALVVVCAKLSALWATDEGLGRLSFVGGASIYPAVQSFCTACRALDLGTAMTTLLCQREDDVRDLLGIPSTFGTAAHIVVGRRAGAWPTRLRRRPLREIAFRDRYGAPPSGGVL